MILQPGATLDGKYKVICHLATGGMAHVYKAVQLGFDRIVALKISQLDPNQHRDAQVRFERECHALSQLHHRNIVRLYDYGFSLGCSYLVMEYLSGLNLAEYLHRNGPVLPSVAIELVSQVCDGLVAASAQSIVHRDLKPSNLVLVPSELNQRFPWTVKIIDFGLVKHGMTPRGEQQLTQEGTAVGTLLYMSPEQLSGGEIDARTDIYALGCIFFECLTGGAPFAYEQLMQNRTTTPQIQIPEDQYHTMHINGLLGRCLATSREKRFECAQDMKLALSESNHHTTQIEQNLARPIGEPVVFQKGQLTLLLSPCLILILSIILLQAFSKNVEDHENSRVVFKEMSAEFERVAGEENRHSAKDQHLSKLADKILELDKTQSLLDLHQKIFVYENASASKVPQFASAVPTAQERHKLKSWFDFYAMLLELTERSAGRLDQDTEERLVQATDLCIHGCPFDDRQECCRLITRGVSDRVSKSTVSRDRLLCQLARLQASMGEQEKSTGILLQVRDKNTRDYDRAAEFVAFCSGDFIGSVAHGLKYIDSYRKDDDDLAHMDQWGLACLIRGEIALGKWEAAGEHTALYRRSFNFVPFGIQMLVAAHNASWEFADSAAAGLRQTAVLTPQDNLSTFLDFDLSQYHRLALKAKHWNKSHAI